jgi:NAD(P)-dependent dehydrogenase (short-subunit alcohol dehydrogenase family)
MEKFVEQYSMSLRNVFKFFCSFNNLCTAKGGASGMEKSMNCELPGIENKVVVVTGGASGIGREICNFMSTLGARIAVIDILEEKGFESVGEIESRGGKAFFTRGDTTDEASIQRCMAEIKSHFEGIDILVNNAGIATLVSFEQMTLEVWKRIIDVNLTGAYICTKAALPYLQFRAGAIIMISSGSAITGTGASAAYAASKGGLNSFVRALSRELAPKGVRVNGVAPRSIESELLTKVYSREYLDQMAREIPVGRMGTSQDIAHVVAFLASDLSSFISGETLLVDGGRTFGK